MPLMPPAPTAPPASPAPAPSSGLAAWLRTREGRITAGAAAALLVVVVALARRGRGGGTPFSPEAAQGGPDTTLQDRLDQLGLRGGTIEELIGSTSDLTTGLADLTGRIDQIKPNTTTATPPSAVTGLKASSNWQDIAWNWNPVPGATRYLVELIQGVNSVMRTSTVTGPGYRVGGGLRPDHSYRLRVTPLGPGGSGPSASLAYRTKAKK